MTDKTYTIAGSTNFDGRKTFRFANGKMNVRRNMLKFKGHTAIKLLELPRPMNKVQAIAFLKSEGVKAVLPTRSANKRRNSPIVDQANALIAKKAKAAATREANKAVAAPVQAAPAVEAVAG